jgi:hypothetical protein
LADFSQVGSRKTFGDFGNEVQIDVLSKRRLFEVGLKDVDS